MIELKKEFTKGGVSYTQVYKDAELAIYELSQASVNDPSETVSWYEVFKPTVHKADKYHPDDFELYPYDEAFGNFAFCCSTESSVAKTIYNHFPKHKFNEPLSKFIVDSYEVNGIKKPLFHLTQKDLANIIGQNMP